MNRKKERDIEVKQKWEVWKEVLKWQSEWEKKGKKKNEFCNLEGKIRWKIRGTEEWKVWFGFFFLMAYQTLWVI